MTFYKAKENENEPIIAKFEYTLKKSDSRE